MAKLNASLATIKHGRIGVSPNPYTSPSPSGVSTPVPFIDLSTLQTEGRNFKTHNIDVASTEEMCEMINEQDQTVAFQVQRCIPTIARVIDALAPKVRAGGRVVYVGAGTSGRLGILDASEIPPTFSSPYGQWIGLIAGGNRAIQKAVEGAEDSPELGELDLRTISPPLCPELDSVIGLAASGRTPYVLGALEWARRHAIYTAGICCVAPSTMAAQCVDIVECPVGPEVVTGSTRMKSGTAQKMILNMISTGVQLRIGKTYGNLMVDVKRSNAKLINRARGIFRAVLEPYAAKVELAVSLEDGEGIDHLIDACDGSVKKAMVAARWRCSPEEATERLDAAEDILKKALEAEVHTT
ncbi:N-acetylmuramic acid 6-phosphate [Cutaneotrichosporon oleaginosum]|uniref:N-acetylmuramic acid 6-phosphate n=1 Tax=Cutaneotrichosporon oleaginosum TaxID=879819 RepID=A0A0J0XI77_9TREE|nr:N-acetylmuramic acid 6-phosphate [Cutaneotrichosporon oleaginosum]KLT40783.1 N-acetylmuramic acid 6-phosphate [Cutaneotrichosporon oleaginosum]TXT11905.1 hypothetical protein COLE_02315 [Cutaneotrichosporon oleaginosum]